jgi:hypothetical protein
VVWCAADDDSINDGQQLCVSSLSLSLSLSLSWV